MIRIYQVFSRTGQRPRFNGSVRISNNWFHASGESPTQVISRLQSMVTDNRPSTTLLYESDLEDLDLFLSQHLEIQL